MDMVHAGLGWLASAEQRVIDQDLHGLPVRHQQRDH